MSVKAHMKQCTSSRNWSHI